MIRATFVHGGFQPSMDNSFRLSIGSNIVDRLSFVESKIDKVFSIEYVFITDLTSDVIDLCLLPNGGTTAFINTLELRPLGVEMYDVVYGGRYLKRLIRWNVGATDSDPVIRYPDDVYDRVWFTPETNLQIPSAKTSRKISLKTMWDNPPLMMFQSACASISLDGWYLSIPALYEPGLTQTFYVNLYFAEVQVVEATDVRSFSILLNDETYYANLTIGTGGRQVHSKALTETSAGATFTFIPVSGATLGPILNGIEYYGSGIWVVNSTDNRDVNALEVIKTSLGLGSWTGDPCFPVPYSWVTCETGSRVTSIKLSNYSLTGTIPTSIADLTALTDLWLDNNQNQGAIPDLKKLTKLKTL
ncbi:hypothetical protein R1flu_007587 [Riccia fluitans]|uniref:Malectin-like domain-containing protein n=1 Tax=Riccia fluitans TaxID=41844 RepID=A0ABD1YZA3_9MARC